VQGAFTKASLLDLTHELLQDDARRRAIRQDLDELSQALRGDDLRGPAARVADLLEARVVSAV